MKDRGHAARPGSLGEPFESSCQTNIEREIAFVCGVSVRLRAPTASALDLAPRNWLRTADFAHSRGGSGHCLCAERTTRQVIRDQPPGGALQRPRRAPRVRYKILAQYKGQRRGLSYSQVWPGATSAFFIHRPLLWSEQPQRLAQHSLARAPRPPRRVEDQHSASRAQISAG